MNYFSREWKKRIDQEENNEDDTLSYTLLDRFIFDPVKSAPLTGNEMITTPNMIVMVICAVIKAESFA